LAHCATGCAQHQCTASLFGGIHRNTSEYWDYLEHDTWVNLQIVERFKAEGIDFAFPTQTLHHAGDDKRPLTVVLLPFKIVD